VIGDNPLRSIDGDRRIVTYEPSEFIGRWCERTSSFEFREPSVAPVPQSRWLNFAGDMLIVVLALLVIFSVPGLIIYAMLR
jgi:hypothetical protein